MKHIILPLLTILLLPSLSHCDEKTSHHPHRPQQSSHLTIDEGHQHQHHQPSEAEVTLDEDSEEDTIEEELERLGSDLNIYFKNHEAQRVQVEPVDPPDRSFGTGTDQGGSALIAAEEEEELVLVSTLSGRLTALSRSTGQVKWSVERAPAIRAPATDLTQAGATFLPDPSDGSLYMLAGPGRDALRKLPFSVPDLVAASPCRSSDGLLYTGKKIDGWLGVDRLTGQVQEELSADGAQRSCPVNSAHTVFIGRTEYTVSMHDSKAGSKRWNVTFTQYSALDMNPEQRERYPFTHFTTTSSGRVMTFDRETGSHLWQAELDSPVVAVFTLLYNVLYTIPHTTVATETLRAITDDVSGARRLVPTLYIGEHKHGLYALPSLADSSTVQVITSQANRPLIEGPKDTAEAGGTSSGSYIKLTNNNDSGGKQQQQKPSERRQPLKLIGHYDVPNVSRSELTPLSPPTGGATRQPPPKRDRPLPPHHPTSYLPPAWTEAQTERQTGRASRQSGRDWRWLWTQINSGNTTFLLSLHEWRQLATELGGRDSAAISWERITLVVITVTAGIIGATVLLRRISTPVLSALTSSSGVGGEPSASRGSRGSSRGSSRHHVTAEPQTLESGIVKVGNISFDPDQCLGKGCEGTFVFRGWFDTRDVAVKRLLPECFTFADREVALLRESDQHPNVIRYFCTEQDRQFRYIALELCLGTVSDYVQGRYDGPEIAPREILRQATAGVAHLHQLSIVHRDIKPHNVLLASRFNGVVAMISDFGLCKKLSRGRASFSRRSGVAGTEGWIAPEMADGESRATCAVDVFSLGCVFYYVLSPGQHPFGESFRRQYNILSGEYSITSIADVTVTSLVRRMIGAEPDGRPTIGAVLAHPVFWTPQNVLHFFQDVSDRIEKETADAELVRRLERRSWEVHDGNWRDQIDPFILDDLGKFRSYRPNSLRDLLRALRNKRNHYRELPEQARAALGAIPDEFVRYWTSRFPRLLVHTWSAAQCIREETVFQKYYPTDYDWTLEPDLSIVPPWRRSAGPGGSPSPRRRGRVGRAAAAGEEQPPAALLAGSQPGMSLIGALLGTDARQREPDEREKTNASSTVIAEAVRRRLVDIVQEGGVVVENPDDIVHRRASLKENEQAGGVDDTALGEQNGAAPGEKDSATPVEKDGAAPGKKDGAELGDKDSTAQSEKDNAQDKR